MKRTLLVVTVGLFLVGCGDDSVSTNLNNNQNSNSNSNQNSNVNNNQNQATCGNGIAEAGEQCDDGNTVSGDGCSATCTLEFCGDGTVNGSEVCDDGNNVSGDGCSSDCMSDETCGNGVIDSAIGELCDDGNNTSGDGCQANCTLPSCGDGTVDTGEVCDDGNTTDGDGCNSRCSSDESCGNSVVDTEVGEQCDDGNATAGDGCSGTCQLELCGNGTVDASEVCDDGNNISGDGCRGDCMSDESCGNGTVDLAAGEQCDDGNATAGDGCSDTCQLELCGNGVVDPGEVCDDGNTDSNDGCSSDCQVRDLCGDGILQADEECDDATANSDVTPDACRTNCMAAHCGDSIVDSGEACDDGNTDPANATDDFCSANCTVNSWPCGEWPGYMPTRFDSCRFTMHDVTVNGSTTGYAVVQAGATFPTTATINYQHCGYCPNCIVQGYTGLMAGPAPASDDGTLSGCNHGWQECDSGLDFGDNSLNHTFTAPSQPGTYYFRFGSTLEYSCASWGCPDETHNLFALCVQ